MQSICIPLQATKKVYFLNKVPESKLVIYDN